MFSSSPDKEASDPTKNMSAAELYQKAKTDLDDGDYTTAIKNYEILQSRFPYGRFAQQSMLETAYAYYRQGEVEPAISAADRFIKQFPNNAHIDYAYYVKGLANFNGEINVLSSISAQDPSERDPQAAQDSFNAFKELISRYPDSNYTADAKTRMQYLTNMLAKHELHVASYYLRRNAYIAAANRAQDILKTYPNSPSTRPALEIMIDAYDKMGLTELRDGAKQVLAANGGVTIQHNESQSWWKFWK